MASMLPGFLLPGSLPAQQWFESDDRTCMPPDPLAVEGWLSADLDGDGDTDLIPVRQRVYLRNDTGRFTRLPWPGSTGFPQAVGDLDGDGDIDVLCFDSGRSAEVLVNDGSGRFRIQRAWIPEPGYPSYRTIVQDVTGDGRPDILGPGLWRNAGGWRFVDETAARGLPALLLDAQVAEDLDGDGDLDLVMSGRLYVQTGAGAFTDLTASRIPTLGQLYAAADYDGDGDVDLAHLTWGGDVVAMRNDGSGRFSVDAVVYSASIGFLLHGDLRFEDLDADGDPDLVFSPVRDPAISRNDAGVFAAPMPLIVSEPAVARSMFTGVFVDADGDGDLDLVSSWVQLWMPSHEPLLLFPVRLWFQDPGHRFASAGLPGARTYTVGAMHDLDRDGDLDAVGVISFTPLPVMLENDGTGRWHARDIAAGGEFVDLDGDGDLDSVALDVLGASFQVSLATAGPRGFAPWDPASWTVLPSQPFASPQVRSLSVRDMDGDGVPDLLSCGRGGCELWLGNGDGTFVSATGRLGGLIGPEVGAAQGDLDGDGDLDAVLSSGLLLEQQANGSFQQRRLWSAALPADVVRLGDLDGDGRDDVVAVRRSVYQPLRPSLARPSDLLWNLGGAVFSAPVELHYGDALDAVFGDFDADGDADLLLSHDGWWAPGPFSVLENRGTRSIGPAPLGTRVAPNPRPIAMVAGDVDGDGDLDIVSGLGPVWRNLERQLVLHEPLHPGADTRIEVHGGPLGAVVAFADAAFAKDTPFGRLQLLPAAVFATRFLPPAPSPSGFLLSVPARPELVGLTIHVQAMVADGRGLPKLTNALRERIVSY
ncbi:MAG: FG-GAP repeat domain-containing protein [Planctomycetota bacterium]